MNCYSQTNSELLNSIINKLNYTIAPKQRALLIIADNSCLACNRNFAKMTSGFLNRTDISFIISASAGRIDLSEFMKNNKAKV